MDSVGVDVAGRTPATAAPYVWPEWYADMARYQEADNRQVLWQLTNTLLPYFLLWYLMILSVQSGYPYALTLALSVVASAFLIRIFIIFHDCVHGSFSPSKGLNTFIGYLCGVMTFTSLEDWRFSHLRHHVSYANLDSRGFGDIWTMTLEEYAAAPRRTRLAYFLYRNPLVLFGLGAIFNFVLSQRLPTGKVKRREWMSVILTNLLIAGVILAASKTIGWKTYILVQLPVIWIAGMGGIWLFYVQHQFDGVLWTRRADWDALRAAMEGSSFYKLPALLRWFSGNIGYHHVHHLRPRIPNYKLKLCCDSIPELNAKKPLTIRESLSGTRLKLWDEERRRLVGFP
jgi:omega-6 fatty acid desaturase (delta-12 desaturase)